MSDKAKSKAKHDEVEDAAASDAPVNADPLAPAVVTRTPRVIPAGAQLPGGTWEMRQDGSRVEVLDR